jgi:hypothetical protein
LIGSVNADRALSVAPMPDAGPRQGAGGEEEGQGTLRLQGPQARKFLPMLSQFERIPLAEFGPSRAPPAKPPLQPDAWCYSLLPAIDRSIRLVEPARPAPLDEDAQTVPRDGRFISLLQRHHAGNSSVPGAAGARDAISFR